MNQIQKYIPANPFTRPARKRSVTRNIVWHYTGNRGAGAELHYKYFGFTLPAMNYEVIRQRDAGEISREEADKRIVYASANTFIDPKMVLEIIPNDEEAWHASQANPYSVGVELCIEADGSFHPDTIRQAIEYGVYLNKKYALKTSDYLRHYDVTGKICPAPWVTTAANPDGNSKWEVFKSQVTAAMAGKGNRVMQLTDEQWTMLASALNKLYHGSVDGSVAPWVFADYTWAQKAYDRTLTVDEMLWLQTIMFTRSQGIAV